MQTPLYETLTLSSPNADSGVPGFPLRHWSIQIYLVHQETKQEVPADIFTEVTYNLHESFGDKAKQSALFRTP
jgi:transcription initiation factor TFIID/TFIIF subunit